MRDLRLRVYGCTASRRKTGAGKIQARLSVLEAEDEFFCDATFHLRSAQ
jgi:hypothetical protein